MGLWRGAVTLAAGIIVGVCSIAAQARAAEAWRAFGSYALEFSSAQVEGDIEQFRLESDVPPGNAWRDEWTFFASGQESDLLFETWYDSSAAASDRFSLSLASPQGFLEVGRRQVQTGLPGLLGWGRRLVGAWGEWQQAGWRLGGFAGVARGLPARDRLFGRGARGPYLLSHPSIVAESERVSVDGIELQPGRDYVLDPINGILYFDRPILDGLPIEVVYEYEVERPPDVRGGLIGYQVPGIFGIGLLFVDEASALGGATLPGEPPLGRGLRGIGGGGRLSPSINVSGEWLQSRDDSGRLAMARRAFLEWTGSVGRLGVEWLTVEPGFTLPGEAPPEDDFDQLHFDWRGQLSPTVSQEALLRSRRQNLRQVPDQPLERELELLHRLSWEAAPGLVWHWETAWLRRWDGRRSPGWWPAPSEGSEEWRHTLGGAARWGPWQLDVARDWRFRRAAPPGSWPQEPGGHFPAFRAHAAYAPEAGWRLDVGWEDERVPAEPPNPDRTQTLQLAARTPAGTDWQMRVEAMRAFMAREGDALGQLTFGRAQLSLQPFGWWPGLAVAWNGELERQERPVHAVRLTRAVSEWQIGGPIGTRLAFAARLRSDQDRTESTDDGAVTLTQSSERTFDARWRVFDGLSWQVGFWQTTDVATDFVTGQSQLTHTIVAEPAPGWEVRASHISGSLRRPEAEESEGPEGELPTDPVLPAGAGEGWSAAVEAERGPLRWGVEWRHDRGAAGWSSRQQRLDAAYSMGVLVLGMAWERLDVWGEQPHTRHTRELSAAWEWPTGSRLEAAVRGIIAHGATGDFGARIWELRAVSAF